MIKKLAPELILILIAATIVVVIILAIPKEPAAAFPGATIVTIVAMDDGRAFVVEYQYNPRALIGYVYGEEHRQTVYTNSDASTFMASVNGSSLWVVARDEAAQFFMPSTALNVRQPFQVFVPEVVK